MFNGFILYDYYSQSITHRHILRQEEGMGLLLRVEPDGPKFMEGYPQLKIILRKACICMPEPKTAKLYQRKCKKNHGYLIQQL